MKNLIIILFLFLTSITYGQLRTIKVQGSGGSAGVDSIWRTLGTDSIMFSISGRLRSIKDSGVARNMQQTFEADSTAFPTIYTRSNIFYLRNTNQGFINFNNNSMTFDSRSASTSENTSMVIGSTSATITSKKTGETRQGSFSVTKTGVSASISGTTGNSTGIGMDSIRFLIQSIHPTTNTVLPLLSIDRSTQGTAANGIGASIEFKIEPVTGGTSLSANTLVSRWVNATTASRESELDITGINNAVSEVYAKFKTGSLVIVGNGADTLATKAYARSVGGGGGGGNTIYTGDDALTGSRVVSLAGNNLEFDDVSGTRVSINPGDGQVLMESTLGKVLEVSDDNDNVLMKYDASNQIEINSTGTTVTSDSIMLNSTLSGTSNGYIWTLANSALGTGYWAAAGSGGITDLNGETGTTQTFATGTTGTDFNIASATNIHTLNLPNASATNRGLIIPADWSTFNGKQAALNGTGFVKATGTTISYDNSTYLTSSDLTPYLLKAGDSYTTTTGNGLGLTSSTLTTGTLAALTITGTAAASNTKKAFSITSSGANATASQTVTGQTISVTNTGTTNTNVGLNVTASGASATNGNIAALFTGNVGIGIAAPTQPLHIFSSASARAILESSNSGASGETTWQIKNNAGLIGNYGITSSGYTTYGVLAANEVFMYGGAANALSLSVNNASGVIKFGVGVDVPEVMRLTAAGRLGIGVTSPTSLLHTAGSFAAGYVAKTATYTATISDYTIECTANTFTVTLPTAVGITGRIYNVVNSGAGTITVGTTSSQTFVNVVATPTTLTLAAVGSVMVQSNGANWMQLK